MSKVTISKIINRTISVLSAFAIIICALYVYTWIRYDKPNILGYRVLHVVSESMEPTIMTGDFVIGHVIDPEDVQVGDIVTYRVLDKDGDLTNYCIIHRVIQITNDGFVFKGDNNDAPDDWIVQPKQIGYIVRK